MHTIFRRFFLVWACVVTLGSLFIMSPALCQTMDENVPVFSGQGDATPWAQNEHGRVRLIAASPTVGEEQTIMLGLHFQLQPGWHVYWRSPGDAGYAPKIDWTGSVNAISAEMQWPKPHRFAISGIQTIGYSDEVVIPIQIRVQNPGQPVHMAAYLDYLTCNDICIPYRYRFALDLLPGGLMRTNVSPLLELFQSFVPSKDTNQATMAVQKFEVRGEGKDTVLWVIASKANGFLKPDIFIESALPLNFGPPAIVASDNNQTNEFTIPVGAPDPELFKQITRSSFTLTIADTDQAFESTLMPMRGVSSVPWPQVLWIVALGIMGGLILNVMPCVLPVLSIKLLHVIGKADQEMLWIRRGFLATAMGIITCFWLLAGIAAIMKLTGMQIGWGIQFQQPVFLLFMTALLLVFAANMWGWFEIPLPTFIANWGRIGANNPDGHSISKEFLTGMFATLLATPCSAPFLGTALGFGLSQGIAQIFLIFTAIGLGLALPYFVVAAFPGTVRLLPKPGRWMLTVRRILAVFLVLTAVWLAAITVVQIGEKMHPVSSADEILKWQNFEVMKIGQAVAAGKIVFVDVTADWCLTCKANERFVINTEAVQKLLSQPDVVLLRADWTRHSDSITQYLQSFGRYGIPFNAVYSKKFPEGKPLPELLSKSVVEDAIAQAR